MKVIHSQKIDISTNDVISWLKYLGTASIIRVDDKWQLNSISINNKGITYIDHNGILSDRIESIWFRRGEINFKYKMEFNSLFFYYNEMNSIISNIDFSNSIYTLNKHFDDNINKIEQLKKAQLAGLSIPSSLYSDNVSLINDFYKKSKKRIITKPILNNRFKMNFNDTKISFSLHTKIINKSFFKTLKKGLPALFQEYIQKNMN